MQSRLPVTAPDYLDSPDQVREAEPRILFFAVLIGMLLISFEKLTSTILGAPVLDQASHLVVVVVGAIVMLDLSRGVIDRGVMHLLVMLFLLISYQR